MNFFKKFLQGGPQYLRQDLFNTIVFLIAKWGLEHGNILDFFKSSEANGLVNGYKSKYPRDEFLLSDFEDSVKNIVMAIADRPSFNMADMRRICELSDRIYPDGSPIKQTSFMNAPSHPNVSERVDNCTKDFLTYYELVN